MRPPGRTWTDLKVYLQARFVRLVDWNKARSLDDRQTAERALREIVERLVDEENVLINLMERERLVDEVLDEVLGFGPLHALLADNKVQEIRVEGPDQIHVRCGEYFTASEICLRSLEQLYVICGRLLGTFDRPFELATNCVVERTETPPNFFLTAHFPASQQQSPRLHFRRLRPTFVPPPLREPRLPVRDRRVLLHFLNTCQTAGIKNLCQAEEPKLRALAEQVVGEFLAKEDATVAADERDRLVALLLYEAREPGDDAADQTQDKP